MKHIIAFSGGEGSALVAIEVSRRFGPENVILLNHDISGRVEDADIKRFKREVANYLGLPITYKNYRDLPAEDLPDQFEVVEEAGSFVNIHTREALCTHRLKTQPFSEYLAQNFPDGGCVIYYGFEEHELLRVDRRKTILNDMGYKSDYPLALWGEGRFLELEKFYEGKDFEAICKIEGYENHDHWERTIRSVREIEIEPPTTYSVYEHANCDGCLKAGKRHWYVTYVHRRDTFERAKLSEKRIGATIIHGFPLKELEVLFEKMQKAGVPANEHEHYQTFWAKARRFLKTLEETEKPCECQV